LPLNFVSDSNQTEKDVDSHKLDSNIWRQGDVLGVRTADCTKDIPAAKKAVVLAYGEKTGHCHAFMARSRAGVVDEGLLAVSHTAWLQHEEHEHIEVPPGLYDLPVQVEMTDADDPVVVAD
jgi:hypothetical protein